MHEKHLDSHYAMFPSFRRFDRRNCRQRTYGFVCWISILIKFYAWFFINDSSLVIARNSLWWLEFYCWSLADWLLVLCHGFGFTWCSDVWLRLAVHWFSLLAVLYVIFQNIIDSIVCDRFKLLNGKQSVSDIISGRSKTIVSANFEQFWSIGVVLLPAIGYFTNKWSEIYITISSPAIPFFVMWLYVFFYGIYMRALFFSLVRM